VLFIVAFVFSTAKTNAGNKADPCEEFLMRVKHEEAKVTFPQISVPLGFYVKKGAGRREVYFDVTANAFFDIATYGVFGGQLLPLSLKPSGKTKSAKKDREPGEREFSMELQFNDREAILDFDQFYEPVIGRLTGLGLNTNLRGFYGKLKDWSSPTVDLTKLLIVRLVTLQLAFFPEANLDDIAGMLVSGDLQKVNAVSFEYSFDLTISFHSTRESLRFTGVKVPVEPDDMKGAFNSPPLLTKSLAFIRLITKNDQFMSMLLKELFE